MSTYSGIWPEKSPFNEADIQVTVDKGSLPAVDKEVPGSGKVFGWANLSPWANKKLLAISILFHELHIVMKLPEGVAHQRAVEMYGLFVEDRLSRFGKQWSMSSEDIQNWIQAKFPFWL
ncbi:MAG TPA: hypothetical protein VKQ72_07570 [Aggregatilineales bacterium]|nr:hypothetical protein [Aggregatilineales bacterium]